MRIPLCWQLVFWLVTAVFGNMARDDASFAGRRVSDAKIFSLVLCVAATISQSQLVPIAPSPNQMCFIASLPPQRVPLV
ncbi:hypothetical protein GE09DRAFT_1093585 [Coniochaeta sp. 2T2.1]|nr:hypothetical protein GE09DRAFT_1093585 [Coniochaeta sp. 2T2.1]